MLYKEELRQSGVSKFAGRCEVGRWWPVGGRIGGLCGAGILGGYELALDVKGGRSKQRASLSSSVMFIERYRVMLKRGGRLVTVIDDSLLGNSKHKDVRDFFRKDFLISAVVSLPGDAFQRSQARVKSSILVLRRKSGENDEQGSVFMYYCTAVGVDDSPRQRSLPVDEEN